MLPWPAPKFDDEDGFGYEGYEIDGELPECAPFR